MCLKGPKQKQVGSETEASRVHWGLHCLNCSITPGQGLLYSSELVHHEHDSDVN